MENLWAIYVGLTVFFLLVLLTSWVLRHRRTRKRSSRFFNKKRAILLSTSSSPLKTSSRMQMYRSLPKPGSNVVQTETKRIFQWPRFGSFRTINKLKRANSTHRNHLNKSIQVDLVSTTTTVFRECHTPKLAASENRVETTNSRYIQTATGRLDGRTYIEQHRKLPSLKVSPTTAVNTRRNQELRPTNSVIFPRDMPVLTANRIGNGSGRNFTSVPREQHNGLFTIGGELSVLDRVNSAFHRPVPSYVQPPNHSYCCEPSLIRSLPRLYTNNWPITGSDDINLVPQSIV